MNSMPMWFILFMAVSASNALTVNNPEIPFMTQIRSGLTVGSNITITGRMTSTANNVAINLNNGWKAYDGTVILHFNIRFHEDPNAVVIDTHVPGVGWSNPEWPVPFPFEKESRFQIEILCEDTQFNISVDGKFYFNFKYRLPLQNANVLQILEAGEVEIFTIVVNKVGMDDSSELIPCVPGYAPTTVATTPSFASLNRYIHVNSNSTGSAIIPSTFFVVLLIGIVYLAQRRGRPTDRVILGFSNSEAFSIQLEFAKSSSDRSSL